MRHQHLRRRRIAIATVVALSIVSACGDRDDPASSAAPSDSLVTSTSSGSTEPTESTESTGPTTSTVASTTSAPIVVAQDYSERGPFAVGVATIALGDSRPVLVFYPVDRGAVNGDARGFSYTATDLSGQPTDVWPIGWATAVPDAWMDEPPSTSGPFPLVVFSHGWGNSRFTHSLHNAHLASWGFVVAAPEHISRNMVERLAGQVTLPPNDLTTVADTIELMTAENSRGGSSFEGVIATEHIAVEGYSAGGRDSILAADLPDVDTVIAVAGTPPVPDDAVAEGEIFAPLPGFDIGRHLAGIDPPQLPTLMIVAANDIVVVPAFSRSVFEWLAPPKRLAVIADTGHTAFTDGCRLHQQGRLPGMVDTFGLDPSDVNVQLANNGCTGLDLDAEQVAAVWNHLTIAHLEWTLGFDADVAAASLERAHLDETFPGVLAEYTSVG